MKLNIIKIPYLLFILLGSTQTLISCNDKKIPTTQKITIKGYFKTVGNSPFQQTVFVNSDNKLFFLKPDLKKKHKIKLGKKTIIQCSYRVVTLETVDKKIKMKKTMIVSIDTLQYY